MNVSTLGCHLIYFSDYILFCIYKRNLQISPYLAFLYYSHVDFGLNHASCINPLPASPDVTLINAFSF